LNHQLGDWNFGLSGKKTSRRQNAGESFITIDHIKVNDPFADALFANDAQRILDRHLLAQQRKIVAGKTEKRVPRNAGSLTVASRARFASVVALGRED
jgi:hypothetical protein